MRAVTEKDRVAIWRATEKRNGLKRIRIGNGECGDCTTAEIRNLWTTL